MIIPSPQTGLGDNFYIGDNTTWTNSFDLSGDVGTLTKVTTSLKALEVTGINKFGIERLPGQRDGEISWTAWFNPGTNAEHFALKQRPTNDVQVGYFRGTTVGNSGAGMNAKQITYNPKRGTDGSLSFDVQALANADGLEWGRQLTAGIRTDTTATNGTSFASGTGGATAFGFQAYVWLFALIGTNVVVSVQDSPDNSTFTSLATNFASMTTNGVQRIASANNANVNQYLRVITSGTFSSAQFAVLFMRNLATVAF